MDYMTRRLRAGGEFDCPVNEALVYEQIGLAVPVKNDDNEPPTPAAPALPPPLPMPEENTEVARLAAEYERITGNKPDKRWRETRLQTEIEGIGTEEE